MRTFLILALGGLTATAAAQRPARTDAGSPNRAWQRVQQLDKNNDGKITQDEFSRGEKAFKRLDKNGDGTLTAADFAGNAGQAGAARGVAGNLVRAADADGNREVTRKEWEAFLGSIADGKKKTVDTKVLGEKLQANQRTARTRKGKGAGAEAEAGKTGKAGKAGKAGARRRGEKGAGEAGESGTAEAGAKRRAGRRNAGGVQFVVRSLDSNGDRLLQVSEIDAIFKQTDRNGDGVLQANEYGNARGRRRNAAGRGKGGDEAGGDTGKQRKRGKKQKDGRP